MTTEKLYCLRGKANDSQRRGETSTHAHQPYWEQQPSAHTSMAFPGPHCCVAYAEKWPKMAANRSRRSGRNMTTANTSGSGFRLYPPVT